MNTKRMEALAAALESGRLPEVDGQKMGFDMSRFLRYDDACGTAGCVAGVAVAMYGGYPSGRTLMSSSIAWEAARILNLDGEQAMNLFIPEQTRVAYRSVTPQQAAQAVRALVANPDIEDPWADSGARRE